MTFNDIFNTYNSNLYYNCASIVSGVSVLRHQIVNDEERNAIDESIKSCFQQLDKIGVTFRFQNSLLYIAEKFDCRRYYLHDMINIAVDHAGGIENVYRRIE